MAGAALVNLIKDGKVLDASHVALARSSIDMAVRAGAPRPDISSVDALTRVLLQANSIAYSSSVSGDYLSTELFQRLGITDQIMGKSRELKASESAPQLHVERQHYVVERGAKKVLPIEGSSWSEYSCLFRLRR